MQTQTSSALRDIRTLLSNRNRWTQCAIARDAAGIRLLSSNDPRAVSYCLYGAMYRAVPSIVQRMRCLAAMQKHSPWRNARGYVLDGMSVNDQLGYDAVMTMLDATIEAEEAESEGARICRLLTTESNYPERNVEIACAV